MPALLNIPAHAHAHAPPGLLKYLLASYPAGTMAASGVGGDKDEHAAERFLLMAADSGNSAEPAVWYRLAQLHLSVHEPAMPADVDLYIRTGTYELDSPDAGALQSREQSARHVSPELAKAVRREIRLLIKEVRTAKQRGAPVKAFRPAGARVAAYSPDVSHDSTQEWKPDGERGLQAQILKSARYSAFM